MKKVGLGLAGTLLSLFFFLLVSSFYITASIKTVSAVDGEVTVVGSDFPASQPPTFLINTNGMVESESSDASLSALKTADGEIAAEILDKDKVKTSVIVSIKKAANSKDSFLISPANLSTLHPGKYTLSVTISDKNQTKKLEQDFTWGVLAINLDKSTYKVGEKVNIGVATLDNAGETLCDSQISLVVTAPSGEKKILSTISGSVAVSKDCAARSVTDNADYGALYIPAESGRYNIHLKATTKAGTKERDIFFETKEADFVVRRSGSMRIFPEAKYKMNLEILSVDGGEGVFTEVVPAGFIIEKISDSGTQRIEGSQQMVSWNITLNSGEKKELSYEYDAPDVSPEIFLLGPAKFTRQTLNIDLDSVVENKVIFEEPRSWEIASDAPGTSTKTVEYMIGQNTTTDVTAAANWAPASFGVYVPDIISSSTAVKSAYVDYTMQTSTTSAAGTITQELKLTASGTWTTVNSASFGTSTEHMTLRQRGNFLSTVQAAIQSPGTYSFDFRARISGTTHRMDSAKLVLTYYYDDVATTQIKTVKYYGGQMTSDLGLATTQQFSLAAPGLPESSVSIYSAWAEVTGVVTGTTTTDTTLNLWYDSDSQVSHTIDNVGANTAAIYILFKKTGFTDASHTFNIRNNNSSGNVLSTISMEQYITYSFNYTNSTTLLKSYEVLMGEDGTRASTATLDWNKTINIPETSLTWKSIYIKGMAHAAGDNNNQIAAQLGSAPTPTYIFNYNWNGETTGNYTILSNQTFDLNTMTTGDNNVYVRWQMYSGLTAATSRSATINLTYSYAKSSTTTNNSAKFFVGQDTVIGTSYAPTFDVSISGDSVNILGSYMTANSINQATQDGTITMAMDSTGSATYDYNSTGEYAWFVFAHDTTAQITSTGNHTATLDSSRNNMMSAYLVVYWQDTAPITISGTSDLSSGTVAIAVNGALKTGVTGSISGGVWSLSASVVSGQIITVWVDSGAEADESTGVTKYAAGASVTGMVLNRNVLSLGSSEKTSLTVTNLGLYDYDNNEDVMFTANSTTLSVKASGNTYTAEKINILAGNDLTMGAETMKTADIVIDGSLTSSGSSTYEVSRSWDNNSVFTAATSTVVMTATTGAFSVDSTGAVAHTFYNLTLGQTSGTATWTLGSHLRTYNGLAVSFGTLTHGSSNITIEGDLTVGASGTFSGSGAGTISVQGSATGAGMVSLSGGSFSQEVTSTAENFGASSGTSNWTTNNLIFSNLGANSGSWGTSGKVTYDYNNTLSDASGYSRSIVVDSDYNTYVAGYRAIGSGDTGWVVRKYNSAGALDTSWSSSGSFYANQSSYNDKAFSLAIDSSRNIYVTGESWNVDGGGEWTFAVAKINANGHLCSGALSCSAWGTGGSGYAVFRQSATFLRPTSVALDTSGNIYIGGSRETGGNYNWFITKFNSSGVLDTSWGTSGYLQYDSSYNGDFVYSLVLDSSSNLYVAGQVPTASQGVNAAIRKYNSNGVLCDGGGACANWGTSGMVTYNSTGAVDDIGFDVAMDSSESSVYLMGRQATNSYDWFITKYAVSGGSLVSSFGNGGVKTWNSGVGSSLDGAYSMSVDKNNDFYIAGDSSNALGGVDLTVRKYNASGGLVTNWGTSGMVTYNSGGTVNESGAGIVTASDGSVYVSANMSSNGGEWLIAKYGGTGADGLAYVDATITTAPTGTGQIIVGGTLQVGKGTDGATTTLSNSTNNRIIDTNGDFTITSKGVFQAASGTTSFTIAGNFTNDGTFTHSSGTVTFDGAGASNITYSANTTFYKFASSTAGKQLNFDEAQTTIIANDITIQGTNCTTGRISLDSYVNDNPWLIKLETGATQNIDYIDLEDADATGTVVTPVADNSTETGSNTGWTVNAGACAAPISISGSVYQTNESTLDTTGYTIAVSVNNGAPTTTTASAGSFTFASVTGATAGIPVMLYIQGHANNSNTITIASGSNMSGIKLYISRLAISNDNAGTTTDASLGSFGTYPSAGDTTFSFGADVLTVNSGYELHIESGKNFSANGDYLDTGGDFHVAGTATLNTTSTSTIAGDILVDTGATLNINASTTVSGGDITTAGTATITTSGTPTVTLTGSGNIGGGSNAIPFYNLTLGDGTLSVATIVASDLTISNVLRLDSGLASSASMNGSSKTITLSGSGTPFVITGTAPPTFTPSTSTVNYTGSSATNIAGATYYDLNIGGSGTTVTYTALADLGSSHILTIVTSSGTNTFDASNKTITLSGSGTPFVISASEVFTPSTSLVKYTGTSATDITNAPYNNLETTPASGSVTYSLTGNQTGANDLDGSLTIGTNATLTTSVSNYNLEIAGSYSNSGTFTAGTGTVTFDDTAGSKVLAGNMTGTSKFNKIVFDGVGGGWIITSAIHVSAANATDTLLVNNGTVTLGNGANDNLEVNGKTVIAGTAGQTATLQTTAVDQAEGTITVDVNNNASAVACVNCIVQVGATTGAGQGNFKIAKNTVLRLNPATASSDTGVEVESTGYLEVLGSQDATGTSDGNTNETTLTDTSKSWGAGAHNGKTIRMTSGLAIGMLYPITGTGTSTLTRDTTASADATMTVTGSGATRKICSNSTTLITANRGEVGRYINDKTGTAGYLKIVRSINNDATCSGSADSFTVVAEPGAFSMLTDTDTFAISDAILTGDQYEILDYASVTAEAGTACNATISQAYEGYIWAKAGSQTNIQYGEVCNLGRFVANKYGATFVSVVGSNSNEGININKSKFKGNYYAMNMSGISLNNSTYSKGITNNYFDASTSNLLQFSSLSNGNTIDSNRVHSSVLLDGSRNNDISNNIISNKLGTYGLRLEYSADNNSVRNNKIYGNPTIGLNFYSGVSGNTVSNNEIFGNNNGFESYSISSGNTFLQNNFFANTNYGFYIRGSSVSAGNKIFQSDFWDNTTSDIYSTGGNHQLEIFDTSLLSNTAVSGVINASQYVISRNHNKVNGSTKIWGKYSIPSDSTYTPQNDSVNKYNYASYTWEKAVEYGYYYYYGTGTRDADLQFDVSSADLSLSPYEYKAIAQAGGTANCATATVFDVYRNGTDTGLDATCGTEFTDTSGSVNVKFTIQGGATAYALGDTYTFTAWDASNDTNTAKTLDMMQDGDIYTVPSGTTLEMKGQDTNNPTVVSRGGSTTAGYGFVVNGTIDANKYKFSYLKGASGIGLDLGSTATVTDIANGTYDNYQNVGATDTYIRVHSTIIGAGSPTKTFANLTFLENTDGLPEYSVTESGGTAPADGYYWQFNNATCTGWTSCEDSDSEQNTIGGGSIRWTFVVSISGSVYQTNETTLDTTGYTIAVSVNNGAPTTTTASAGSFTFASVTGATVGTPVMLYIQGHANNSNTITIASGSNMSGIKLYISRLAVTNDNASTTTNANICAFATYPASGDNTFTCSGNNLTTTSGNELHVESSKTYVPSATVTTNSTGGDFHVAGTATLDTATNSIGRDITVDTGATLNINASTTVSGGDITTAGTATITTSGTPTVTLTGSGNIGGGSNSIPFYNLTLGDGTLSVATIVAADLNISNVLRLDSGLASSASLNGSSKTITLSGSGTPFVITGTTPPTFTASTSIVNYTGSSATNITATTYNNLYLKPSSSTPTYTLLSGTTTTNANMTLGNVSANSVVLDANSTNNPTLNVAGALTVNAGSTLSGNSTGTITVNGNVDGAGTINLTAGIFDQRAASTALNFGTTSGSNNWTFNNLTYSNNITSGNFGVTSVGGSSSSHGSDAKQATRYTLSQAAGITKLVAYLDGNGTGTGNQVIRGVIYSVNADNPDALLATSSEVVVTDGQSVGWVDLPFASTVNLSAGDYYLGFITGANNQTIRFWYNNAGVPAGYYCWNADTYSNGAADPFGSHTDGASSISIYASYGSDATITTASTGTGQIIVGGTLQVGKGTDTYATTLDNNLNDRIIDANGNVDITSKGTLQASSSSAFNIAGNFTNDGTFSDNDGTVTFDSYTETNTVTLNTATTFHNIVTDSNVTVTTGSLVTDATGSITYTTGSPIVTIGGATGTLGGGSGTHQFFDLVLSDGAYTTTTVSDFTVNGQFKIDGTTQARTFDASSKTITMGGSGVDTSRAFYIIGSGNLTPSTSTIIYTGTSATEIQAETYNNLHFKPTSGSPAYQLGNTTGQTIATNNQFTVGNGTNAVTVSTTDNSPTVNVGGTLTVDAAGILSGSGSGTTTVNGHVVGGGTINLTGGTFDHRSTASTANFGSSSGSNDWTLNNLTFSNASSTESNTTAVKINDASNFGSMNTSGRQMLRDSSGNLWAIIADDANNDLEAWKSIDGGSTWNEQDSTNSPAIDGFHLGVAIGSNDTIHVVYGAAYTQVDYVTFGGGSWGTPENILDRPVGFSQTEFSIALDSNDKPHLVFMENSIGGAYLYYYQRTTGSWGSQIDVNGGVLDGLMGTSIAINSSNLPVIASINNGTTADANAYLGNQNAATSFTKKQVDTSVNVTLGQTGVSIAVDSNGDTWISYVDATTNYITLAKHTGSDWSTGWSTVTNSNPGYEPSIAINGSNVYVFYQDSADNDIKYDRYNGSTWLGETTLDTGTFQDVKAKWSYLYNNGGTTKIDYLYSDNTDIYWNALTLAGDVTITTASTGTGQIIVGGTLQVGKGTDNNTTILDNNTNDRIINANGNVDITSKGTLQASSSSAFTIAGNYTNSGLFTSGSGTVTFDAGSAGKTLSGTLNGTSAFGGITFDNINGGWTISNALTATGTMSLTNGSLTQGANIDLLFFGNVALAEGTTFTKASGTGKFKMDGDNDNETFTDSHATKVDLGSVIIGQSPGTTNLSSDMSATDLTINSGDRLNTKGYEVTLTDYLTNNGTFDLSSTGGESDGSIVTLGGNWTSGSGSTFTPSTNSTVVFNDSAKTSTVTYVANTSFYNLTVSTAGKQMKFDSAQSTTVTGTLTIQGTNCTTGRVFLDPETDNDDWAITTTGATLNIDYADIEDSTATGSPSADNSTEDNGGNTGWTVNAGACGGNTAPNSPATLTQKTSPGAVSITESAWTTDNTPDLGFTISDPDGSDTVKYEVQVTTAADTTFATPILDYTHGSLQTNPTTFAFTVGSYGGGSCTGTCPATLTDSSSGYLWRVKAIDNSATSSAWVEFGVAGTMDMKVDATACTGGTIKDGTDSTDDEYNDGSLSSLSAYWTGTEPSCGVSNLQKYEYAIGTTAGGTNVRTWTDNTTNTTVTASGLTINTGQTYFFTIRTTDNAGNTSTVSSNGQQVLSTFTVSLTGDVSLGEWHDLNGYTTTGSSTVTVSTNAYNGFDVYAHETGVLTNQSDITKTIANIVFGSYASPAVWSGTGFGYTSNDTTIGSGEVNKFGTGTLYAPFSMTGPGDIVADHYSNVSGTPISNEAYDITYKVQTSATQAAGKYSTQVIYTVTPKY